MTTTRTSMRYMFQSTHSLRSATVQKSTRLSSPFKFQSTHSLRSATWYLLELQMFHMVSIHALLAECDRFRRPVSRPVRCFNPRTPCGVRPYRGMSWIALQGFNPRTPCGVRQKTKINIKRKLGVSIHALLAECDFNEISHIEELKSFNPRTPCGVRLKKYITPNTITGFQSTHSLRSATSMRSCLLRHLLIVSIHALLAECDCAQPYTLLLNKANHTLRQPP